MSYYNRSRAFQQKYTTDDCVSNIIRNIIKAQDEVRDDGCSAGCNYPIQQLRGTVNENGPRYTTIPFILYCSGTCKPFIGSGIYKHPENANQSPFFGCVETPIFRVKQFVNDRRNCVELELLVPAFGDCEIKSYCVDKESSVCGFFEDPITAFLATGICMTVDLKHIMGITCLDPINPR